MGSQAGLIACTKSGGEIGGVTSPLLWHYWSAEQDEEWVCYSTLAVCFGHADEKTVSNPLCLVLKMTMWL